ncbi:MAG: zinc-binding dehydrogenase [Calditrichaeota bacterium]|nr:zinc-binding dehydrogenase [Calditrichota bacterium]
MKQIVITRHGQPEVLMLKDVPEVHPGKGQVRIQVKASGVNFADILARKGLYPDAPKVPCVVGYEVAGVIDAVGEDVPDHWVGKNVLALTRFQGYSEQVVVDLPLVIEMPRQLDFPQAAALPVNYLTAYQLVVVMGGLQADETVLIHNAGGGVGLAALQLAKKIGARTIGTASARKHAFLKEKGLDVAIDYRKTDWVQRVLEVTDGRGVELVIDPIGGKNFKQSYQVLRATGRLGMFGISAATEGRASRQWNLLKTALRMPFFHPIGLMNKNRGVFGVNLGHLWKEGEKIRRWFQAILNGVEEGWIRPHVDHTFSFSRAADAHRYIEERRNMGKVILVPDPS